MRYTPLNIVLIIFAAAGFIAGYYGVPLLAAGCMFFIFIILLSRYWNHNAFSSFDINTGISKSHAEFDEKISFNVELINRKFLPLVWLKLEHRVDKNLVFSAGQLIRENISRSYNFLQDYLSLKWFERVKRKYMFRVRHRGLYFLGQGSIIFNGILGLHYNIKKISRKKSFIVYPRIVPVQFSVIEESQLFGSTPQRGWLHQDRLNRVGTRPYVAADAVRDINWKTSARHNRLETNIYQPSLNKEVHLFLNNIHSRLERQKLLEKQVLAAASLAERALRDDYSVGFYSNLIPVRGDERYFIKIKADDNPGQRDKIMSSLALVQNYYILKMNNLMSLTNPALKSGSAVILITDRVTEKLHRILYAYNKNYNLTVLYIGSQKSGEHKLSDIRELRVRGEGAWNEIQNLELVD